MLEHAVGERTIYAHLTDVTVALGQAVDQGDAARHRRRDRQLLRHRTCTSRSGPAARPCWRRTSTAWRSPSARPSSRRTASTSRSPATSSADPRPSWWSSGAAARSTFLVQRPGPTPLVIRFGRATDQPVVGDWDGDGLANLGVRTPASSLFRLRTPAGVTQIGFGARTRPAGRRRLGRRRSLGDRRHGGRRASSCCAAADGSTTGGRARRRRRPAGHRRLERRRAYRPRRLRPGDGDLHAALRRRDGLVWTAQVRLRRSPATCPWPATGTATAPPTSASGTRRPPPSPSDGPRRRPRPGRAPGPDRASATRADPRLRCCGERPSATRCGGEHRRHEAARARRHPPRRTRGRRDRAGARRRGRPR